MEQMKNQLIAWLILSLALFLGCQSSPINTDIQNYKLELVNKKQGKWYIFQDTKLDSLFVARGSVAENRMYYYESREELLHGSSDAIHNYVRGYVEYGHFKNEVERKALQNDLLKSNTEADCVIGIGKDLYAIDDDNDLAEVIRSIEERILRSFGNDLAHADIWCKPRIDL